MNWTDYRYVQAFLSSQLIGKNGNFWIGYKETKSNDTITMWNSGHVVDFRFGDVLGEKHRDTSFIEMMIIYFPCQCWFP